MTQLRTRVIAIGSVIAFLLVAGIWIALTQNTSAGQAAKSPAKQHATTVATGPLSVVSVTPASNASDVSGNTPIEVQLSEPVAASSPMPSVKPGIAGTWQGAGTKTLEFVPAVGFKQGTTVTITVPGGPLGLRAPGGGLLPTSVQATYHVGTYRTARVTELLAQLGYLPVTWAPAPGATNPAATDAAGQIAAAYNPPQGTYTWDNGYPWELHKFWRNGSSAGLILKGAVMAFEADHGLAIDGIPGPEVWRALLSAIAANQVNKHGYTYAIASEANPETLTIWHDGRVVLRTVANTGIPQAPTTLGTAPVYLKYYKQIMRGKNPNGTKYADLVYYVSYFRNGEAVHYYDRASYGFPQSLGCVELPWDSAKQAWPYLTYGSLVTVEPGVLTPSTSPTDPTT
jgi:hypothetical protein